MAVGVTPSFSRMGLTCDCVCLPRVREALGARKPRQKRPPGRSDVQFYLTERELNVIEEGAAAAGYEVRSAYIEELLFRSLGSTNSIGSRREHIRAVVGGCLNGGKRCRQLMALHVDGRRRRREVSSFVHRAGSVRPSRSGRHRRSGTVRRESLHRSRR